MSTATAIKPQIDGKKKHTPISLPREVEPKGDGRVQEAALIAEIGSQAKAVDREAESAVQESIKEVRLATPEVTLQPGLEDLIKSPQAEADAVLTNGPTINVDITEEEYKEGLKLGAKGNADREKVVFGTASLVALAIWVKRMIKLAHKHAMRIVFRKSHSVEYDSTSRGKEVKNAG